MMKKFLIGAFLTFALLCVFFLGPEIGKSIYFAVTPEATINSWKSEFRVLDQTFPRTETNEIKRLQISRKLAQRGINIDGGLRDESIEHHNTPYTIFVMTFWRWEELFGW